MRRFVWLLPLVLSCSSSTPPPEGATSAPATEAEHSKQKSPTDHPAAAGVDEPQLAKLLIEHWEATMQRHPTFASRLGDHRYDDKISDKSFEMISTDKRVRRSLLARAQGILPELLKGRDKVVHALFVEELQSDINSEVCKFEQWSLSARGNPVTEWSYLPELHKINSVEDAENLVKRYGQIAGSIDQETANLKRGAEHNWVANAESTRRVLEMVGEQLKKPVEEWAMAKPLKKKPDALNKKQFKKMKQALLPIIKNEIKPAIQRYHDLVANTVLPQARKDKAVGVGGLPFGKACYEARIKNFTTLNLTADEIHTIGLNEIKRINKQMADLGNKLFGAKTLDKTLASLRADPALRFDTKEAVVAKAESALAKAREAIPKFFGRLPKAPCVVREIPDYEAPYTTIAYYRQPAPDGSKPGEYFINSYQPETRTRYEAEALAFHESIPGHHLQIAIAQELPALPSFIKHGGMTAFVEGWALYTEQLSEEMGLYSGDLDRMGMLSYEAWRAARLVVDTGLHAKGWSRDEAKAFMQKHTALALNNIDNEVDRYIVWPGQALAYKLGQMEIWRLRRDAEKRLGDKFDIKGFHDTVLGQGAVSLPVLKDQVEAWIVSKSK